MLSVGEFQFRIFYALRRPPRDAAEDIKRIGAGVTPVLLLPNGLKDRTGLNEVLLDGTLPDRQRVIRDVIAVSNIAEKVSALLTAPDNARLVVCTRFAKVWFDKIEITGIKPGTHPFRFIEIMAANATSPINGHDLAEQLSAGRTDGDQTARTAKMAAKKAIEAALKAKRLPFDDPFKSEKGSYRLTVPAYIV